MGGAERVLLLLLDSLDPALFEPALVCPDEGPLTREARERGIPIHLGHPSRHLLEIRRRSLGRDRLSIAAYPFDMAVSVARLARLIRAGDFDLVLTNSAKADIYGTLAARLAGRPVAWRMHDLVDTDAFSKLNVFLLRTCARFLASRVIPVSQASAEKMAGLGVPARSSLSHTMASSPTQGTRMSVKLSGGSLVSPMTHRSPRWSDASSTGKARTTSSRPRPRSRKICQRLVSCWSVTRYSVSRILSTV